MVLKFEFLWLSFLVAMSLPAAQAESSETKCRVSESDLEVVLKTISEYDGIRLNASGVLMTPHGNKLTISTSQSSDGNSIQIKNNGELLVEGKLLENNDFSPSLSLKWGWLFEEKIKVVCSDKTIGPLTKLPEDLFKNKKLISIGELHGGLSIKLAQQTKILEFARTTHNEKINIVLEMFELKDQANLDRFNDGRITAKDLMVEVGWDRSWGWTSSAYEELANKARALGIKLYAGDLDGRITYDSVDPRFWLDHGIFLNLICSVDERCLRARIRFYSKARLREDSFANVGKQLFKENPNALVIFYTGALHASVLPRYFSDQIPPDQMVELDLGWGIQEGGDPEVANQTLDPLSPWPVIAIGGRGALLSLFDRQVYGKFSDSWRNLRRRFQNLVGADNCRWFEILSL